MTKGQQMDLSWGIRIPPDPNREGHTRAVCWFSSKRLIWVKNGLFVPSHLFPITSWWRWERRCVRRATEYLFESEFPFLYLVLASLRVHLIHVQKYELRSSSKKSRYYLGIFPKWRTPHPPFGNFDKKYQFFWSSWNFLG